MSTPGDLRQRLRLRVPGVLRDASSCIGLSTDCVLGLPTREREPLGSAGVGIGIDVSLEKVSGLSCASIRHRFDRTDGARVPGEPGRDPDFDPGRDPGYDSIDMGID